jgi:hypothetical protein
MKTLTKSVTLKIVSEAASEFLFQASLLYHWSIFYQCPSLTGCKKNPPKCRYEYIQLQLSEQFSGSQAAFGTLVRVTCSNLKTGKTI